MSLLSAGSIEPGLVAATDAFMRQAGKRPHITWATAPAIRRRIHDDEVFDVVIAPLEAIEDFARQHKLDDGKKVHVGRVGVGVVARADVEVGDISSVDALKSAVLVAQSIAFNRASSGLYVETLLKELGIYERIQQKIKRCDDGPELMAHLIGGSGREIGFGAIVEILMFRERGLRLVGPLPAGVQHWTTYFAAPMVAAPHPRDAQSFLDYLATAPARALFASHGIT